MGSLLHTFTPSPSVGTHYSLGQALRKVPEPQAACFLGEQEQRSLTKKGSDKGIHDEVLITDKYLMC